MQRRLFGYFSAEGKVTALPPAIEADDYCKKNKMLNLI
jgi:hypothetical protein